METSTPTSRSARRRRRIAVAVIAGVGTFGVIGASAASLGGITGSSLGADAAVIGSCDTDGVSLTYTNTYAWDHVRWSEELPEAERSPRASR